MSSITNGREAASDSGGETPASKKRPRRKVLTLPATDENGWKTDFIIDEGDYRIVKELSENDPTKERMMPELVHTDDEKRVCRFRMFGWSIPDSIGGLTNLTDLQVYSDRPPRLPASIARLKNLRSLYFLNTGNNSSSAFRLPEEIGELVGLVELSLHTRDMNMGPLPSSISRLTNLESLNLRDSCKLSRLPNDIGNLTSLKMLSLHDTGITELPDSIGELANLEICDLTNTIIPELPETFGDLCSLKTLALNESKIRFFPSSIGRLHNLEHMILPETSELSALPPEFGDLIGLKTLDLHGSSIESLPPSIGRLRKLERLDLQSTQDLSELPEDIGGLVSLKELNLYGSFIESLPSSIGELRNLKRLYLPFTQELKELPNELGNLSNLEELDLEGSGIQSLPSSIEFWKGFKSLVYLNLGFKSVPDEVLLELAERNPLFGFLGFERASRIRKYRSQSKLCYALACNRARARIGRMDDEMDHLWPILLQKATNAFDSYEAPHFNFRESAECRIPISVPDAIYRLLVDEKTRESFSRIFIHRRNRMDTLPH